MKVNRDDQRTNIPPKGWFGRKCPHCGLWVAGTVPHRETVAGHGCKVPPVHQMEFPVKGGAMVFSWPDSIGSHDVEDIRELMQITLTQIERRAQRREAEPNDRCHEQPRYHEDRRGNL